jgi:hypothetical protein
VREKLYAESRTRNERLLVSRQSNVLVLAVLLHNEAGNVGVHQLAVASEVRPLRKWLLAVVGQVEQFVWPQIKIYTSICLVTCGRKLYCPL